jgi:hypothetical protein
MNHHPTHTKFRWIIVIIWGLFLAPMVLAWLFYTHKTWLPAHTVNRGRLLTPPLSLKQLSLDPEITQHRWILLLIPDHVCRRTKCQKNLLLMHQIQRALGKDQHRLALVLLTTETVDYAWQQQLWRQGVWQWRVESHVLASVLRQPATWYVVDPFGNIVLNYAANDDPEGILDDLQYLMRVY